MNAPVSAQLMNESFINRLSSPDGISKLAAGAESLIRDRLREVRFCSKIIPPEPVTKADLRPSMSSDTVVKIVHLEPQSKAIAMSFRGQPSTRIIRGARMEVGFFTISSELFQKTEQELMVYDYPITKVVEENSVKDVQEISDREFVLNIEAAVQATQAEANGSVVSLNSTTLSGVTPPVEFSVRKGALARTGTPSAVVRPMQRTDFPAMWNLAEGRRLRLVMQLLSEPDFNNLLSWTVDDNGDKIQSETTVDGYKYNTLLGRPYVRTIKTDILRPGNVYAFTAPEFLGKFYLLNNLKFYIDKKANLISFQCWEDLGMAIVNIGSIAKTELYSGDATSVNVDSLQANFVPRSADQLGAVNNRVDEGVYFPKVVLSY